MSPLIPRLFAFAVLFSERSGRLGGCPLGSGTLHIVARFPLRERGLMATQSAFCACVASRMVSCSPNHA